MSAGVIVVAALIAAAATATATTVVKQATGSGQDNVNDAFGDWLKNFFVGFAANSVGGAAGAAAEGAESGMTAAETANAVEIGNAAQLGNAGANAAAGVGTASSEMAPMLSAMESSEMAAAEGMDGVGSFGESAGLSAPNTTGMDTPSWLSETQKVLGDVMAGKKGVTQSVMDALGYDSPEGMFDYANESDMVTGELTGDERQQPVDPRLEQLASQMQGISPFGGHEMRKQQGFNFADWAEQDKWAEQEVPTLGGGFRAEGFTDSFNSGPQFDSPEMAESLFGTGGFMKQSKPQSNLMSMYGGDDQDFSYDDLWDSGW